MCCDDDDALVWVRGVCCDDYMLKLELLPRCSSVRAAQNPSPAILSDIAIFVRRVKPA